MNRVVTFDTGNKSYHAELSYANAFVISAGHPERIKKLIPHLDRVDEVIESKRGIVTVHGEYKGVPITGFSTQMGPSSVAINLPELIEACDSKDMFIIRLGTSGGLQPYLKVGDMVVTTDVEIAESVSEKIMGIMYEDFKAVTDNNVQEVLYEIANKHALPFQKVYTGKNRTTDDIYWDAINSKNKRYHEAVTVSMEASPHIAIRDWYNLNAGKNIQFGELLTVSDMVVGEHEHIDASEFAKKQQEVEKVHLITGLESLVKLSK